ncbi:Signal peptidase I, bacterial type [uncultured Eubacteriales bacterium]|uniref:Signal peptidase I n=1 Tax=uncultured Eubacteriales bacterium TaxID=172733 RepID=A0A212IWS1_9FIRM|nr:Signal peptidase I, bacterial type [uncultured Eubacteriales bacterium]
MEERKIPTTRQLKEELLHERKKKEYRRTLRSTVYILLVVAAVSVLVATLFLPVLQVTGTSMEPTLETGQIVVAVKNAEFERGDVIAFYYNNKVLLKRVIGLPGDKIVINADGNVSVNGEALEEPYLSEKSLGQTDIEYPYQVPDGKIFVMGDHRATSVDSRTSAVGCIADEFIVGKVVFRVWPTNRFGEV